MFEHAVGKVPALKYNMNATSSDNTHPSPNPLHLYTSATEFGKLHVPSKQKHTIHKNQ
jgi:hypothetical protein